MTTRKKTSGTKRETGTKKSSVPSTTSFESGDIVEPDTFNEPVTFNTVTPSEWVTDQIEVVPVDVKLTGTVKIVSETDITVEIDGPRLVITAPLRVYGSVNIAEFGRELRDTNVRAHSVAKAAIVAGRVSCGAKNTGLSEKISKDRTAVVVSVCFERELKGWVANEVRTKAQESALKYG